VKRRGALRVFHVQRNPGGVEKLGEAAGHAGNGGGASEVTRAEKMLASVESGFCRKINCPR
jgi:hypothetical protein